MEWLTGQTFSTLGVVPVFVNAGAAVLPAVVGALASVAAALAKPKILVPVLLIGAVVGVGGWYAIKGLTGPAGAVPAAGTRPTNAVSDGGSGTDWAEVALAIIRQRERAAALGQIETAVTDGDEQSTTDGAAQAEALIFRGDVGRSGYLGGPSPVDLVEIWQYRDPRTMYLSSPLVADGAVYSASCYLLPGGSGGGVFRLNATDGSERWYTDELPGGTLLKGFFSSPALTADRKHVVIGQGLHLDFDCYLVCVDAETGRVVWSVPTPLHVESSPAIEGDIVVAGAGAIEKGPDHQPQGDPEGAGHPGYVFAVDINTGEELWRYPVNDPESSPAVDGGVAYIGSGLNGQAVVALRIAPPEALGASGEDRLVWKTDTPFPAVGPVTLTDDLAIVGCGNSNFVFAAPDPTGVIIALDRQTGEEVWRYETEDTALGAIAVKDGVAIAAIRNGEVIALDAATGESLWKSRPHEAGLLMSSPAFTGSCIYLTSADGYLLVLDPRKEGELIEKHYLNEEPGERSLTISSPIVAGGRVYVGSETGGLRCFAGKTTR